MRPEAFGASCRHWQVHAPDLPPGWRQAPEGILVGTTKRKKTQSRPQCISDARQWRIQLAFQSFCSCNAPPPWSGDLAASASNANPV
jgi:hypothetical protein